MTFTPQALIELAKPLDKSNVANRTKGGQQLSYVEGWHVIAEANRIFGFDNWTRETIELIENTAPTQNDKGNHVVSFRAKVRVTAGGVVREGTGFGSGIAKDIHDAYEGAIKEAETDAMKRALMTFGNPFGLALYDKSHANVVDAPPQPSIAFESHLQAIQQAPDMETLRLSFEAAKADKSLLREEGEALILAKEQRKRQLTPAPKTLGEHLDNLEKQEKAA